MEFEIHPELDNQIKKLSKKDKSLTAMLLDKINEIKDSEYIEHYKNLRSPLSKYKRVHVTKQFVLLFYLNSEKNILIFRYFDHRDNIYTKKYD